MYEQQYFRHSDPNAPMLRASATTIFGGCTSPSLMAVVTVPRVYVSGMIMATQTREKTNVLVGP